MLYNKEIDNYIYEHTTSEDPVLAELNRETHLKILNPRMISGHPQGKLLEIISRLVAPKNILEIGTYTGYSAICLAKGLQSDGVLHTIERNDELESIQDKYFKKAGIEDKICRHIGNAIEIIPNLNIKFDLVFIDADKQHYPEFYKLIIDKVNKSGLILADNVLWNGKVIEKSQEKDIDTIAIKKFNKMVQNDNRTETCILPIRDGISLIQKV